MEKNITVSEISKLSVEANVTSEIEIVPSAGNEVKITCRYEEREIKVEEAKEGDSFRCKIYDPDQGRENAEILRNMFPKKRRMNAFSIFGSLHTIFENIGDLKVENADPVEIKIYLPQSVKNLKLKMNNGTLGMEEIQLDKFKLKANNVKCSIKATVKIKEGFYDLNNGKLKIPLNSATSQVEIEANNAKIRLMRSEEFKGRISLKGNNCRMSGDLSGDESLGLVKIRTNNSRVDVLRPEAAEKQNG